MRNTTPYNNGGSVGVPCLVTRRSHLGLMGDIDIQSVLLISSLLWDFVVVAVTADNPASHRRHVRNVFSAAVAFSEYSVMSSPEHPQ